MIYRKKKYIYYKLITLLLLLNTFSHHAQSQDKYNAKTDAALINIAYQDIIGKSIRNSDEYTLEKSIQSMGDKKFCRDYVLNCMIYNQSTSDTLRADTDTSFYSTFKDCPRIVKYRAIDPELMTVSFMFYYMSTSDSSFIPSFMNFIKWQSANTPHSPFGNNKRDELSGIQEARWSLQYTEKWIIDYPDEYHFMLAKYDSCYNLWNKQYKGSYADFLLFYARKVGHGFDQAMELPLNNISAAGIINAPQISSLPDESTMRNTPTVFINNAYESLYMRRPDKTEVEFLEKYIADHKNLTVSEFYYAMMTGVEYNYY